MVVTTCDLYEGTFYLLGGCELEAIEGLKLNGSITCRLSFSGHNLEMLQLTYLQGSAEANLFRFRRTYTHLTSLVQKAKKKAKNELANKTAGLNGGAV